MKVNGKGTSAILLLLFVVIIWFAGIQLGLFQGYQNGRNDYCRYMSQVAKMNGDSYPVELRPDGCYISLGVVGGEKKWSLITPELMESLR